MSPGSGVGRGKSVIDSTLEPCASQAARRSPRPSGSTTGRRGAVDPAPVERRDERGADRARRSRAPPISPTKRPPGLSARQTPAITRSARRIQCSAALLKTASNSAVEGERPRPTRRARRARARARRRHLLGAAVDADDRGSRHRPAGAVSDAVAAAEVEDALARPRREQLDDAGAEIADEARVAGVALRVPALLVRHAITPPAPGGSGRSPAAAGRSGCATG